MQIYYQSGPSTPHSFRSIKPTLVTKWPPLFIVGRSKEIIIVPNWNELCFSRRESANKNVIFPVADLIYSLSPASARSVCRANSQGYKSVHLPASCSSSSCSPGDTASRVQHLSPSMRVHLLASCSSSSCPLEDTASRVQHLSPNISLIV